MIFRRSKSSSQDLLRSQLFNERTFYPAFLSDAKNCKYELIIESPFITGKRINKLLPVVRDLRRRGVKIVVNTREPQEHDEPMLREALKGVAALQSLGVAVLFTGGHHRKLVVIDRRVLYEGSLNVLSQNESCEIMRRVKSRELSQELLNFTGLAKFLS